MVTNGDPVCVITLREAYAWASIAAWETGYRWRVRHVRLVGWTARPTQVPLLFEPPC